MRTTTTNTTTTTTTITAHGTETSTTQYETTVNLYTYDELSDDARARVLDDFCEERANDPYFGQWFADCYEREIWDCVRDLEKSITGARVSWRYNRWYSADFDCEFTYDDCYDPGELEPAEDKGYYASMDFCDAWNKHVPLLNALCARFDGLERYMWDVDCSWETWKCETRNDRVYNRLDDMRCNIVAAWYAELEKACDDVRNAIETDLRAEWDYYNSEEYSRLECEDESTQGYEIRTIDHAGRVYYSDCRRWYTEDGEFWGQSNISHECVSIVKAS